MFESKLLQKDKERERDIAALLLCLKARARKMEVAAAACCSFDPLISWREEQKNTRELHARDEEREREGEIVGANRIAFSFAFLH